MNNFENQITELILGILTPFNLHFTDENSGYLVIEEEAHCQKFELHFKHDNGRFVCFTGCELTNKHWYDPWVTLSAFVDYDSEFYKREIRKMQFFLNGRESIWDKSLDKPLENAKDDWKYDLLDRFDEEILDFLGWKPCTASSSDDQIVTEEEIDFDDFGEE